MQEPCLYPALLGKKSSTGPRKVKSLKTTIQKIEVEFGPCSFWNRAGRNDGTIIYQGFLWLYLSIEPTVLVGDLGSNFRNFQHAETFFIEVIPCDDGGNQGAKV